MGINLVEAEAILSLKNVGRVGSEIVCLGRPELFLSAGEAQRLSNGFDLKWPASKIDEVLGQTFAEDFLGACGFSGVRSIDASGYEGATIIHDLNTPIPAELENLTDFLYDGGTIEHVFDIATVLSNVARLLKPGGTALISTCANGQCGHGFYQFSPEVFYRYFEANGFEDVRVYVVGLLKPTRWYRAVDPKTVGRRVQFSTSEPLQLIVVARKATMPGAPSLPPQQSDYAEGVWTKTRGEVANAHRAWRSPAARLKSAVRDRLAYPVAVALRHTGLGGVAGLWRREFFVPFNPMTENV
jgi:SAM-dependent methyltransferase